MSPTQKSKSLPPSNMQNPSRPSLNRTRSLRIPSQPTDIPIPPSLLAKAPHLASPQSGIRRPAPDPRTPSRADEDWLGDTVPAGRDAGNSFGSKVTVIRRADGGPGTPRGDNAEQSREMRSLMSTQQPSTSPLANSMGQRGGSRTNEHGVRSQPPGAGRPTHRS